MFNNIGYIQGTKPEAAMVPLDLFQGVEKIVGETFFIVTLRTALSKIRPYASSTSYNGDCHAQASGKSHHFPSKD